MERAYWRPVRSARLRWSCGGGGNFGSTDGVNVTIPANTFAVAAFVILFVPGFVFAVVRIWRRGFRADDKGIDTRIAQALVVSVIFDAVYLLGAFALLPPLVKISSSSIRVLDPWWLGGTILVGAVLLPAGLAWLVYLPIQRRQVLENGELRLRWVRRWSYNSVPTAWDWAAADPRNRYVRILLPDKRWVGGYYGGNSYVSTYPEPRDIFISQPWRMGKKGAFLSENQESEGVWLTIPDGAIVEWLPGGQLDGK
jgi:hypothetical protein